MDNNQWPEGCIGLLKPIQSTSEAKPAAVVERKPRPQKEQALNCPRCNSTNTKFCYYNNYSLSQPRYFCKTCRRYWTEGGTLRNVPVGGGSRKNKRSSSSSPLSNPSSSSAKKLRDLTPPSFSHHLQNPKLVHTHGQGEDVLINLGNISSGSLLQLPNFAIGDHQSKITDHPNPSSTSSCHDQYLELLKAGVSSRGSGGLVMNSSFMSVPVSHDQRSSCNNLMMYTIPSVLPNPTSTSTTTSSIHDQFKPKFGFSLNGLENGSYLGTIDNDDHHHGAVGVVQDQTTSSSTRLFLPFEGLMKTTTVMTTTMTTSSHDHEYDHQGRDQQNKGHHELQGESSAAAAGYWNGVLGGGGSSW